MTNPRRHIAIVMAAWMIIVFASCKQETESTGAPPVPKPVAWPRLPVETSDSMVDVAGLPVNVRVSAKATYDVLETDPPGLTVSYPAADTKIYYTFIPVTDENRDAVLSARRQRIGLNLNGVPARTFHSVNGSDSQSVLVVAQSGTQSPVQLLAVLPGYVVTATSFINDPGASIRYDSIAPLYQVLTRDMARTLPDFKFDIDQ